MQVPLDLRLVCVIDVAVDTLSELVVTVVSTRPWSRCPHCGFARRRVHNSRNRRVRDQAVSARPVTLLWRRRRFGCDFCGERHLEDHDEFEGRLTRRLAEPWADAQAMSIRAVAPRRGIRGQHHGPGALLGGAGGRLPPLKALPGPLMDETTMRGRHRYVTVLRNGQTGEVLAMVAHRNAAALSRFFSQQGRRWCAGVGVAVTDGPKFYWVVICRQLSPSGRNYSRAGPLPRVAVRPRAHPGAPLAAAQSPGPRAPRLRSRAVRGPLAAPAPIRPPR